MGKLNNALRMLAILRSRKFVKREELSRELEVSSREITRYKESLEEAGVLIDVKRGRYGGYSLINKDYLLPLQFSKKEKEALIKELQTTKNIEAKKAMEKVLAVMPEKINLHENIKYINKIGKNKIDDTETWLKINDAIISKRNIKIKYVDGYEKESERKISPYGLFTFYDSNYLLGLCYKREELRKFKLTRIKEIDILEEKYENEGFDIKKYIKSNIGIIDNERIHIKLKIFYPYATSFKEMIWFENEKIYEKKEEGYVIYEGDTFGKEDLISFVFSLRENCILLEPIEIRRMIKIKLETMKNNYI